MNTKILEIKKDKVLDFNRCARNLGITVVSQKPYKKVIIMEVNRSAYEKKEAEFRACFQSNISAWP